jgi:hypothetical protein
VNGRTRAEGAGVDAVIALLSRVRAWLCSGLLRSGLQCTSPCSLVASAAVFTFAVVDSAGEPAGVIELTEVRVVRAADIDLRHVLDDGDESVAAWRAAHEEEWHSAEMRELLGDPGFTVSDDTQVLAQRFRLVAPLADDHGPAAEPGA